MRAKRGFSLIELIVVIAVMAAIAAAIVPSISGTREAAIENRSIAAAEALNMAQSQYRLENGITAWDALVNTGDAATYTALTAYMDYPEANIAAFQNNRMGTGYTVTFNKSVNGRMVKVTLTGPDGVITY